MTTENISAILGFNSTDDTSTQTTVLEHRNETVQMAPLSLLNTSTFYELNSNAPPSSVSAEALSDVVANFSATAVTNGDNLTYHDVNSISNLTSSMSSAFLPVTYEQSSSRYTDALTAESGNLDSATSDYESSTQVLGDDVVVDESSAVALAVGVAVAAVVLLAVAFILLFFFLRRKWLLRRKQSEVVMENPEYHMERNSSLPKNFDLTMHTGSMIGSHRNNNSDENLTKSNGKRKKDAPRPPIYKPTTGKDSASKRKAPLPPKYLGYEDLYEKDSAAGSAEALEMAPLYTVDNHSADPVAADNGSSHSKPLLESFHPQKKSPKRNSKTDSGEKQPIECNTTDDEDDEDDAEKTEDEEIKTALLVKDKAVSNLSLDSYDKTKNPFFSDRVVSIDC